jgi:magnesium transporter
MDVASAHLARAVPVAAPGDEVGAVRGALVDTRPFESAVDVAVVEGARLVGLIPIERLLAAPDGATAESIMDRDPPCVEPQTDQEAAVWKAIHHGESSLAVVDPDGTFVGLIPPRRLLAVLLREHEEDVARLSGYLHASQSARRASEEPVAARLWHRTPWLVLGLLGALASAVMLGFYERRIESAVAITFFIPGVVYLADAVGTQTEALIIRGLSVGMSVRRVVRLELATGLLLGVLLGLAFLPIGIVGWGVDLALAVALSLAAACAIATVVAMGLPVLLRRLGTDPAFGSGPLATVVQDLLSLVIYLAIATLLVN